MSLLSALVSDLGQRVVTANKRDQRAFLTERMRDLALAPGARVLDFGCGTGLFAKVLAAGGCEYVGYDPDPSVVRYASGPSALTFTASLARLLAGDAFDVVLANCCFHHISDAELSDDVLPAIAALLRTGGRLLVIDVLPLEPSASMVRHAFNVLERGDRKRSAAHLERFLRPLFTVRRRLVHRSFGLGLTTPANPVYNDLVCLEAVLSAAPGSGGG